MRARSLIGRALLAMLVAGGAVACKKDPEPSKPAESAGGDTAAASTSSAPDGEKAMQRPRLPPMPRRGPNGEMIERKKPWADGQRPTREELVQRREQRRQDMLAAFDTDQDGQLSDEERTEMRESRVAAMVDKLDADRDGRLSKTEMEELQNQGRRAMPEFDKIDADHDGFVTVEEMAKHGPRRPRGNRPGPGTDQDPAAPPPPPATDK
jgi:hypothetical protein